MDEIEGQEQQIEQEMKEGYLVRDREQAEVIRDWEVLDSADWPA